LQGAITGGAFGVAGGIENAVGGVAAHAFIGCASAVAAGGGCGQGALSAGFTKAFSGTIDNINDRALRTIAAATVGGTASVLGGGKFGNGAVTGAFSRLFNDEAHINRRSVTLTGGGSFITPIGGVAGNAGFYFSTNPLDIGVIGTGQLGVGYDFGLSGQLSFQKGDLSGSSNNFNISSGLVNASASIENNGSISVSPGINGGSIELVLRSLIQELALMAFESLLEEFLG
jgi:hypothetical protein